MGGIGITSVFPVGIASVRDPAGGGGQGYERSVRNERAMNVDDLVVTPTGARFRGRRFARTIGRGGVTDDKREGDGATPRGVHRVAGMLWRPDRAPRPAAWAEPILTGDLWSDDAGRGDYNGPVRAPYDGSAEALRRGDPMYDLVIVLDWNLVEPVAGRGSAIFVHEWRRPGAPTAGCVAFARADLWWIAARVVPGTRVVVI